MRKKVILHIGAAKTGSSSIQTFLRRNYVAFAKLGHVIPDTALSIGGSVSGDHVFALEALAVAKDAASFRDRVDALFEQSAPDTQAIIFSAENLSNRGNSALIEGLGDAYDLQIVMYLRRQDEFLTAAWQQWHSKIETDFNAWLIGGLKQYGHWDRVLADWQRRAGRKAIVARVFDRATFHNGSLLQDFVAAIGLAEFAETFDFRQHDANVSVTDAITSMVAGNENLFTNAHDNRFYDALGKLTGGAFVETTRLSLLSERQREKIIEYYQATNQLVCKEYFPNREKLFSPIDHAKYRYVSADQMVDEKFRVVMTILAALIQERAG